MTATPGVGSAFDNERYLAEHQATIQLLLDSFPYTTYEPFAFWGDVSYLRRCLSS